MADTCPYCGQPHRRYNTKSEPQRKLWALGDYVSGRFIDYNKYASLVGDVGSGRFGGRGGDTRGTQKLSVSHSMLL